jgi:hypothetical protein
MVFNTYSFNFSWNCMYLNQFISISQNISKTLNGKKLKRYCISFALLSISKRVQSLVSQLQILDRTSLGSIIGIIPNVIFINSPWMRWKLEQRWHSFHSNPSVAHPFNDCPYWFFVNPVTCYIGGRCWVVALAKRRLPLL